jgi:hypothetical protein
LSILIISGSVHTDALSPSTPSLIRTWSYGSPIAEDLSVNSSGNITIVGGFQNATEVGDAVLLRYNASGSLLVQRAWGGSNYEIATGVAVDASGNSYLTGRTSSFGNGNFQIFLVKFGPAGNLLWQETYGGSGYDGWAATEDSGGNVIISGDGVLLKFNPSGSLVWQDAWTGTGDSRFGRVVEDASGDIYMASASYLLKLNSTGGLIWATTWSGMTGGKSPADISLDSNGNVYITAIGPSQTAPDSVFLVKITQDGTILWQRRWQFTGFAALNGWGMTNEGVAANATGVIYVTAVMTTCVPTPRGCGTYYEPLVLEFNSTGSLNGELANQGGFAELGRPSTDSKGSLYLTGSGGVAPFCLPTGSLANSSVSLTVAAGKIITPSGTVVPVAGTVSTPSGSVGSNGNGVILMRFDSPIFGGSVTCSSPLNVFPLAVPMITVMSVVAILQARRRLHRSRDVET